MNIKKILCLVGKHDRKVRHLGSYGYHGSPVKTQGGDAGVIHCTRCSWARELVHLPLYGWITL